MGHQQQEKHRQEIFEDLFYERLSEIYGWWLRKCLFLVIQGFVRLLTW